MAYDFTKRGADPVRISTVTCHREQETLSDDSMEDLKDYSGEYDPNISYQDFSKEVLAKLLNAYCRELLLFDGLWYDEVKERFGDDVALACEIAAWEKVARHEMKWAAEALNIQGNDLAAYARIMQMGGSFALGMYKYDFDFKSPNHLVLTIHECRPALHLERTGQWDRLASLCGVLEPAVFRKYAEAVNPDIETRYLKLPPRKGADEPFCRWEFVLGPQGG